jgi:hypothetical protein
MYSNWAVAVGMLAAFSRLAVGLQAVTQLRQQFGNLLPADRKPLPLQLAGQTSNTLARPTQRRFGIASTRWFNQSIQGIEQFRLRYRQRMTTCSRSSHAIGLQSRSGVALQFAKANMNRPPRYARAPGHERDASIAPGLGFRRRPQSSSALIQRRSQAFESLAYRSLHACASHGADV